MNKYKTYQEMTIEVIRATPDPALLVEYACSLTQKKNVNESPVAANPKFIEYLVSANHQSPLEHASITVLIQGVSRSFLAQITRHRMGSFTSASQHYTTYNEFPNIMSVDILSLDNPAVQQTIKQCDEAYKYLISIGIPKEEARQLLPNAKAVNILWTVNARSLVNFFNQRLCKRNVLEMYIFSVKMMSICMTWFPELFTCVGPDCKTLGGCRQGRMKAAECIDADVPNF